MTTVAVIGVGTVGAQVLWQLARRGIHATGFETHVPGHPRAAAGGESRLFRTFELDDLRYQPIIARADEVWEDLSRETGARLRDLSGALVLGRAEDQQMRTALASAEISGKSYEVLDAGEMARRYPQFALAEDELGLWDVGGGTIFPELSVATTARAAQARGAEIRSRTRVLRLEPGRDGVRVVTEAGAESFDRVVVAAGGWAPQLLPHRAAELRIRRLISAWHHAVDPVGLADLPPFLRVQPRYCYGLPTAGRDAVKLGVGFADHLPAPDPDAVERAVRADELDPFAWVVASCLPILDPVPWRTETYIESYTANMHEIVEEDAEYPGVVVLGGFSGHGFKLSPAIGEIGARLALDGDAGMDLSFLREAPAPLLAPADDAPPARAPEPSAHIDAGRRRP